MLFAFEVPKDECLAHLRGARHLCQGSGRIPLVGKEPRRHRENSFSRTHGSTVGEKKLAVNASGLAGAIKESGGRGLGPLREGTASPHADAAWGCALGSRAVRTELPPQAASTIGVRPTVRGRPYQATIIP